MGKTYVFGNKVVKQGNSFCVRIPSYIAKQAKLKVGKNISVILETNQEFDEDYSASLFFKISKKIKKLKKFSDDKIRVFILIHFKFLKGALDESEKVKVLFFKKLRQDYGDKLVGEYLEWAKLLQEAYIYSKDGSFSVKPEYLKG